VTPATMLANRHHRATDMTKREHASTAILAALLQGADSKLGRPPHPDTLRAYARDAVAWADALWDALDVPAEARRGWDDEP